MTIHSGKVLPTLGENRNGDTSVISLAGDWTLDNGQILETLIQDINTSGLTDVTLELSGLSGFDTAGAWAIHKVRAIYEFDGAHVTFAGVDERYMSLLEEIASHNPTPWTPPRKGSAFLAILEKFGNVAINVWDDIVCVTRILGSVGIGLTSCIFRTSRLRSSAILHQFDQACIGAVPIVTLMCFLIGGIIAQQGAFYLNRFGAPVYAVDLTGILMVREIGVLLTSIMVAGRSGSAITAELGAMKMREEIDALRVLGLDYVEVLVMPRVVALIIAVPVLTFLANLAGLVGAGLLLWAYTDISPPSYMELLHAALVWDAAAIFVGMAKAPFMGLMIALIACVEGLKVEGSTESLGQHTTASVVKAIFMVIVIDGFFALFFAAMHI